METDPEHSCDYCEAKTETDPEKSYDYCEAKTETDPENKSCDYNNSVVLYGTQRVPLRAIEPVVRELVVNSILISSLVILGLSLALAFSIPTTPLEYLNLEDSGFLGVLVSASNAGCFVSSMGIIGFVVYPVLPFWPRRSVTIIYTIGFVVLLAASIFIAVIYLKFATDSEGQTIVDTMRTVWVDTVTDPDYTEVACARVCAVQKMFNCMGFNKGDCDTNPPDSDVCPVCQPPQTETGLQGCYDAFVDCYDQYYASGIIASVLGGVLLAQLVMVWVFKPWRWFESEAAELTRATVIRLPYEPLQRLGRPSAAAEGPQRITDCTNVKSASEVGTGQ